MDDAPRAKESPRCAEHARGAKNKRRIRSGLKRTVVCWVKGELRLVRVVRALRGPTYQGGFCL